MSAGQTGYFHGTNSLKTTMFLGSWAFWASGTFSHSQRTRSGIFRQNQALWGKNQAFSGIWSAMISHDSAWSVWGSRTKKRKHRRQENKKQEKEDEGKRKSENIHPEDYAFSGLLSGKLVFLSKTLPWIRELEKAVAVRNFVLEGVFWQISTLLLNYSPIFQEKNGCWKISPAFGKAPGFSPPETTTASWVFWKPDSELVT